MGEPAEQESQLPTFKDLRNWALLAGIVVGIGSAVAVSSVWIANADNAHESGRTAEQAIIEFRAAKEADERVLRALCIHPDFVKSVECAKLQLRDKERK